MKNFLLLVKKDLKLLFRSKGSALIVVFAPLIIILLLGLSYNTSSQFGLNIGVHSAELTDEAVMFAESLQAQDFSIVNYNDVDKCISDIKASYLHACISLPSNFQIEDNSAKEVTFYLDQSRINLVWIIQQSLEQEFNLKSQELSQNIVGDILSTIQKARTDVSTEADRVSSASQETSSASSDANGVISNLDDLTFTVPEIVETDSVVTATDDALDEIFSDALDKTNDALDELGGEGCIAAGCDEVEDLKSIFSNAKNQLAGSSSGNVSEVIDLVTELEGQVELLLIRLNEASEGVSSATSQTEGISSTLSSTSSELDDISNKLGTISGNLNGLDVSDAQTISTPLITKIQPISEAGTNLDYSFPSLLALIVMFLAIMLGDTLIMMEKTSPAYIRNFMVPVNKMVFFLATTFTNLIIMSVQLIIILLISLAFLPDSLITMPLLFLVLLIASLVFTLIGTLIGYLFSSEETAILASISIGSIMLFLSGLILPIEGMSPFLRGLTYYNPFVITEKLVREVFIFRTGFIGVLNEVGLLLIYCLMLFLIILLVNFFLHKQLMHKISYKKHKKRRKIKEEEGE
jgi:ABC-type multidrug transport system permease subunit